MRRLVVAIDGPAGAGKSDTAKLVSETLGYVHYNSGLTYRAIASILLQNRKEDISTTAPNFETLICELELRNTGKQVFYRSVDITGSLRTSEVDEYVPIVSRAKCVRDKCKKVLHEFIKENGGGIVVEGRDIGTSVLPNADLKIYLTASVESRAQRRQRQNGGYYNEIVESIIKRDEHDMSREIGPLRCAEDAITVDNSNIGLEETVGLVVQMIQKIAGDGG